MYMYVKNLHKKLIYLKQEYKYGSQIVEQNIVVKIKLKVDDNINNK